MWFLTGYLWLYQIIALALGLGFGWSAAGSSKLVHRPFLQATAAIILVGGLLAYFQAASGQAGLWWDIWMLLFLAYVVGCLIAWLLYSVIGGKQASTGRPAARGDAKSPASPQSAAVTASTANLATPPQIQTPPASQPRNSKATDGMAADRRAEPQKSPPGPFSTAPLLWSQSAGGGTGALPSPVQAPAMANGSMPSPVAPPLSAGDAMRPSLQPDTAGDAVSSEDADQFDDADISIIAIRPPSLATAENGKKDDLKRISGIGRVNEGRLNDLGIFHFAQMAVWTPEHAKWVNAHLAFPGRIQREKWISQARTLASGAETEFSKRVKAGRVPTSSSS